MDVGVRNKPIIRSRTLITEKKLDKKVQPIPPTIVDKKKSTMPIINSANPVKKRIEKTASIQKSKTKPKEKTNNENYKQPTLGSVINNMKFAQNAHRAVMADRDSVKIIEPRIDGALMKSILSDYPYANSSNKISTERIVGKKEAAKADEATPSKNEKSAIDFICEVDGESYTSDTTGIIVTMTSWTKRIKNVERTIATILDNSVLPEKIIINLSTSEFPNKEASL
jgi:hypothetical protein